MHVIDLEIMIPASPDFIWRFLGDIASSADWQAGVSAVSFLTTQHEGKGARWRYSYAKSRDVIVEAAAWYDTLGYEYFIVDGPNYGENQGRIRLQEVNEGTLLRWTFNYEAGGVLGGLRNAMRLKRKTSKQIQDSLHNLHDLIKKESGGRETHAARAAVREAPGADERSSYQPRHPSKFAEGEPDASDEQGPAPDLQPIAYTLDDVPGPADGDTKPNPVVLGGDGFLDMQMQMNEIEAATEPIASDVVNIEPEISEKVSLDDRKDIKQAAPAPTAPEEIEPAASIDRPLPARARRSAEDKSSLSVFEIFGLQKPSELANAQAEPGDARKQAAPARGPDSRLSDRPLNMRNRDLSFFLGDEAAPDRDSASRQAPSDSAAAPAVTAPGMRRWLRRHKRPLRSRN